MKRKYGVNVLSLWPWSSGKDGVERAVGMALDAGFDGVQALPLRGWGGCKYKSFGQFVISYEDSFANGGFFESFINSSRKMVGKLLGTKNATPISPLFEDWLFFGKYNRSLPSNSSAVKVVHTMDDRGNMLEINPSAEILGSYRDFAILNGTGRLCWDTFHVREKNKRAYQVQHIDAWETTLASLPNNSIGLIHVHPIQNSKVDELDLLLSGKYCELVNMLRYLRDTTNAPVILEIVPPMVRKPFGFWTMKKTVEYMSIVREKVYEIFG